MQNKSVICASLGIVCIALPLLLVGCFQQKRNKYVSSRHIPTAKLIEFSFKNKTLVITNTAAIEGFSREVANSTNTHAEDPGVAGVSIKTRLILLFGDEIETPINIDADARLLEIGVYKTRWDRVCGNAQWVIVDINRIGPRLHEDLESLIK